MAENYRYFPVTGGDYGALEEVPIAGGQTPTTLEQQDLSSVARQFASMGVPEEPTIAEPAQQAPSPLKPVPPTDFQMQMRLAKARDSAARKVYRTSVYSLQERLKAIEADKDEKKRAAVNYLNLFSSEDPTLRGRGSLVAEAEALAGEEFVANWFSEKKFKDEQARQENEAYRWQGRPMPGTDVIQPMPMDPEIVPEPQLTGGLSDVILPRTSPEFIGEQMAFPEVPVTQADADLAAAGDAAYGRVAKEVGADYTQDLVGNVRGLYNTADQPEMGDAGRIGFLAGGGEESQSALAQFSRAAAPFARASAQAVRPFMQLPDRLSGDVRPEDYRNWLATGDKTSQQQDVLDPFAQGQYNAEGQLAERALEQAGIAGREAGAEDVARAQEKRRSESFTGMVVDFVKAAANDPWGTGRNVLASQLEQGLISMPGAAIITGTLRGIRGAVGAARYARATTREQALMMARKALVKEPAFKKAVEVVGEAGAQNLLDTAAEFVVDKAAGGSEDNLLTRFAYNLVEEGILDAGMKGVSKVAGPLGGAPDRTGISEKQLQDYQQRLVSENEATGQMERNDADLLVASLVPQARNIATGVTQAAEARPDLQAQVTFRPLTEGVGEQGAQVPVTGAFRPSTAESGPLIRFGEGTDASTVVEEVTHAFTTLPEEARNEASGKLLAWAEAAGKKLKEQGRTDYYATNPHEVAAKALMEHMGVKVQGAKDLGVKPPNPAFMDKVAKEMAPRLRDIAQQGRAQGYSPLRMAEAVEAPSQAESAAQEAPRGQPSYRGTHRTAAKNYGSTMDAAETMFPSIATRPQDYATGDAVADAQSLEAIRTVAGNPKAPVTIYRAVPKGVTEFSEGDWVTPSRDYAQKHGETMGRPFNVISRTVPARELRTGGESVNEWGWSPSEKSLAQPRKAETPEQASRREEARIERVYGASMARNKLPPLEVSRATKEKARKELYKYGLAKSLVQGYADRHLPLKEMFSRLKKVMTKAEFAKLTIPGEGDATAYDLADTRDIRISHRTKRFREDLENLYKELREAKANITEELVNKWLNYNQAKKRNDHFASLEARTADARFMVEQGRRYAAQKRQEIRGKQIELTRLIRDTAVLRERLPLTRKALETVRKRVAEKRRNLLAERDQLFKPEIKDLEAKRADQKRQAKYVAGWKLAEKRLLRDSAAGRLKAVSSDRLGKEKAEIAKHAKEAKAELELRKKQLAMAERVFKSLQERTNRTAEQDAEVQQYALMVKNLGEEIDALREDVDAMDAQSELMSTLGKEVSQDIYTKEEIAALREDVKIRVDMQTLLRKEIAALRKEEAQVRHEAMALAAKVKKGKGRISEAAREKGIFGGVSNEDIRAFQNSLDPKQKEALQKVTDLVERHNIEKMKDFVEDGTWTEDQAENMVKAFGLDYVPLKGYTVSENFESLYATERGPGKKPTVGGLNEKSARGRTTEAKDVFSQWVRNIEKAYVHHERMMLGKELRRVFEVAGEALDEVGYFSEKPAAGVSPRYLVPVPGGYINLRPSKNALRGKKGERVTETQHRLAEAMAEMFNPTGNEQSTVDTIIGTIGNVSAYANNWLRPLYTNKNPDFILRNFPRDVQQAATYLMIKHGAAYGPLFVKNITLAFKDLAAQRTKEGSAVMEEMETYGGLITFEAVKDMDAINKDLRDGLSKTATQENIKRVALALPKALEAMGESLEKATRIAVYRTMREKGASKLTAAREAANASANFSRRGGQGGFLGEQNLNNLYLFFRAAIQGNYGMVEAMMEHPARAAAVRGAFASAAFGASMLALNGGDDKEPSRWGTLSYSQRAKGFPIKMGDNWFYIPIPYMMAPDMILGIMAAEVASGKKVDMDAAVEAITTAARDSFSPISGGSFTQLVTPTVLDPVAQILTNEDAFGRPLWREPRQSDPDKADALEYMPGKVSPAAQGIANWWNNWIGYNGPYSPSNLQGVTLAEKGFGAVDALIPGTPDLTISPASLDVLGRGWLGSLYSYPASVYAAWSGEAERKEKMTGVTRLRDYPIARAFVMPMPGNKELAEIYGKDDGDSYASLSASVQAQQSMWDKSVDEWVYRGWMTPQQATAYMKKLAEESKKLGLWPDQGADNAEENKAIVVIADQIATYARELRDIKATKDLMTDYGRITEPTQERKATLDKLDASYKDIVDRVKTVATPENLELLQSARKNTRKLAEIMRPYTPDENGKIDTLITE